MVSGHESKILLGFEKSGKTKSVETENRYHFNFPIFLKHIEFFPFSIYIYIFLKNPGKRKVSKQLTQNIISISRIFFNDVKMKECFKNTGNTTSI